MQACGALVPYDGGCLGLNLGWVGQKQMWGGGGGEVESHTPTLFIQTRPHKAPPKKTPSPTQAHKEEEGGAAWARGLADFVWEDERLGPRGEGCGKICARSLLVGGAAALFARFTMPFLSVPCPL